MRKIIFIISLSLTSLSAFAGGSIGREEVLSVVCSQDIIICKVLKTLKLAESGDAVRIGHHGDNDENVGMRIMPYTFTTKDKRIIVTISNTEEGKISVELESSESTIIPIASR
jgi:hypothetical protein